MWGRIWPGDEFESTNRAPAGLTNLLLTLLLEPSHRAPTILFRKLRSTSVDLYPSTEQENSFTTNKIKGRIRTRLRTYHKCSPLMIISDKPQTQYKISLEVCHILSEHEPIWFASKTSQFLSMILTAPSVWWSFLFHRRWSCKTLQNRVQLQQLKDGIIRIRKLWVKIKVSYLIKTQPNINLS